ncbi:MAG: glycosyltransferase family 39 protein, partial [Anaerolineae bacterium]
MRERRRAIAVFVAIGLLSALLGQYYFFYRRKFYLDGILFYVIALAMFGWAWRLVLRTRRRRPRARWLTWARHHPLRATAAVGGMTLSLLAGWLAVRLPFEVSFASLFWLWLIGVLSLLLAFAPPLRQGWQRQLVGWLRGHRGEVMRLVALLAFAVAVRATGLGQIPRNFGGDEGTQALDALELVNRPLGNPFSTGWFSVPTMSFLAYGLAMRIFGATVAGARALSALIGAATVLTTFLLTRELWGERVGWMAALLLACGHYHLHFSRLASNQIADGLFVTLTLWLLVRGLRTESVSGFVLAGASMGLAWYGYFGARLVTFIVGLYLGWRALAEPRFLKQRGRQLVLL